MGCPGLWASLVRLQWSALRCRVPGLLFAEFHALPPAVVHQMLFGMLLAVPLVMLLIVPLPLGGTRLWPAIPVVDARQESSVRALLEAHYYGFKCVG